MTVVALSGEADAASALPADSEDSHASELIRARKADHVRLAANGDVEARTGPGWSDIHLVHEAIPAADFDAIDLSVTFLGRRLRAPLIIAGMTGGHPDARAINACLARAAERHGIAMGVGSQRVAIAHPEVADTYRVSREAAPTAFLVANIGAPQLVPQTDREPLSLQQVQAAIEMVRADALAVHFNYLQESVQPEGDRMAQGVTETLTTLVTQTRVPVIAKETGAGISPTTALALASAGVAAIDVGGTGGTSFSAVEGLRASLQGMAGYGRLGEVFRDWGVPTAVTVAASARTGLPVIATGGVRTGLDAAKAIAVGAVAAGVGRPLLRAALDGGDDAVDAWIEQFLKELRTALFLTGCRRLEDLRSHQRVILGTTLEWLRQLGLAS